MKDITHYFQSPSSLGKLESVSSTEESSEKVRESKDNSTEESYKKRKVLSLKRESENDTSKERKNTASKDENLDLSNKNVEVSTTTQRMKDSPDLGKKRRGRPRKDSLQKMDSTTSSASKPESKVTPPKLNEDLSTNGVQSLESVTTTSDQFPSAPSVDSVIVEPSEVQAPDVIDLPNECKDTVSNNGDDAKNVNMESAKEKDVIADDCKSESLPEDSNVCNSEATGDITTCRDIEEDAVNELLPQEVNVTKVEKDKATQDVEMIDEKVLEHEVASADSLQSPKNEEDVILVSEDNKPLGKEGVIFEETKFEMCANKRTKKRRRSTSKSIERDQTKDTQKSLHDTANNQPDSQSTTTNSTSGDEMRQAKKICLELEETPKPKSKLSLSNAFQYMMSGGNKKSTDGEGKEKSVQHGDTSAAKQSKTPKEEDSTDKKRRRSKEKQDSPPNKRFSSKEKPKVESSKKSSDIHSGKSSTKKDSKKDSAKNNDKPEEKRKSKKLKLDESSHSPSVDVSSRSKEATLETNKSPDAFKLLMASKKRSKSQDSLSDNFEEAVEKKQKDITREEDGDDYKKSRSSKDKKRNEKEDKKSHKKEKDNSVKKKKECQDQEPKEREAKKAHTEKEEKCKSGSNKTKEDQSQKCKERDTEKPHTEKGEKHKSNRETKKEYHDKRAEEGESRKSRKLRDEKYKSNNKNNEEEDSKKSNRKKEEKCKSDHEATKKEHSKAKLSDDDNENKIVLCKGKRKRIVTSDESEAEENAKPKQPVTPAVKPSKPSSLYGYFSPVTRDEAMRKSQETLVTKTVAAEVHSEPTSKSPADGKPHPLGPVRRSQKPRKGEEDIVVVDVTESPQKPSKPKTPFRFKTPEKRKKRRAWQLKIKLLSPAKPVEDLSSDCTGSSSNDSDSDLEVIDNPRKKQTDLKALWAARGSGGNTRLAPIFMSKNKGTSDSKVDRKIVSSVAMAPMRPAPVEHTIGFADVDPSTPMSILFPSISHVGRAESSTAEDDKPTSFLPEVQEEVPICAPILAGSLAIECDPSLPAILPIVVEKSESETNGESWCEKHRPKSTREIAGNERSVQRLRDWLDGWRQRSRAAEDRSQQSSDSESSDYSSGDDFIVSSDDESSTKGRNKNKKKKKHCNTALLVGPCGSGKTAAVYAAAEELGFKVLEMNASSRRSGKRILSELQEATQSHQVRNNTTDQETLNSFFSAKGKNKCRDQVVESQQSGNNSSLSLILVEDVDVVFEEQDEGFLAALNVLAASSKRPLVLVSNEPQCPLLLAKQHRLHLEFTKVPTAVTGATVRKMCKAEGGSVSDAQLEHLIQMCHGDLRRAVLLTQTWSLSGGFPQPPTKEVLQFPLNLDDVWAAMKHAPLPYVLHEDDVVEEEEEQQAQDSDSDHIFSLPKPKQKAKRQRLTSDTLIGWEFTRQATSCPDLKSASRLCDMLATLDTMQGAGVEDKNNVPRPGLSDQPCQDRSTDQLGPAIQHWLASRAITASGCTLAFQSSEQRDRWRATHCGVDQALLEQLPLTGQLDRRTSALDLLPALRDLGRCEQASGRASRRSKINALQSLGLQPGGLTIETLPFILQDTSS